MREKFRIRRYRPGDGPAFLTLVRALALYERLAPPGGKAGKRLLRVIGRRIEVLLATVRGRPVGYAIYLFTYSSFLARPTLFLEDVFVRPEWRKLGIGRAFYRRLEREARRKGCGRLEWLVLDWNRPAHAFYRRLGARRLKEWLPYRVEMRGKG